MSINSDSTIQTTPRFTTHSLLSLKVKLTLLDTTAVRRRSYRDPLFTPSTSAVRSPRSPLTPRLRTRARHHSFAYAMRAAMWPCDALAWLGHRRTTFPRCALRAPRITIGPHRLRPRSYQSCGERRRLLPTAAVAQRKKPPEVPCRLRSARSGPWPTPAAAAATAAVAERARAGAAPFLRSACSAASALGR